MKKLPIGIQTFSEIRGKNYIYVDKTKYVHKLVTDGKVYFLSRPRRFGKSLLISTLKELFKGNKKLFNGLFIHDKWNWEEKYPVIHLDFGELRYNTPEKLENTLNDFINSKAREYDIKLYNSELTNRFSELIKETNKKFKKKVVILIDEYDKAIIDCMKDIEIAKKNRDILSEFYQVLKANDGHLKFIFLTGVTKFSKTSIFSGLNNLSDTTLNHKYANICGYTQYELENCFRDYIAKFSEDNEINCESLLSLIKEWYNGYSWDGKNRLYNPYSILSLFEAGEFANYWFESGTPSFLMDFIKNNKGLGVLFKEETRISGMFPSFNLEKLDFTTLLLQTGYLTIKNKEIKVGELTKYDLAIPNKEVSDSLFISIISEFSSQNSEEIEVLAKKILDAIYNLDNDSLQEIFDVLVASIPAITYGNIKKDIREENYQIWFLSWFKLMGFLVIAEVQGSKGTPDMVFIKDKLAMICEFKYSLDEKLEKLAMKAINQINNKQYYKPYLNYEKIILLGIAFGDREVKSIITEFKP